MKEYIITQPHRTFTLFLVLISMTLGACSVPEPLSSGVEIVSNTPPADTPEYLYMLGKAQGINERITCVKARRQAQEELHWKIEHKIDHLFAPDHEPLISISPAMQDFVEAAKDTVLRGTLLFTEMELINSQYDEETQICRELIGVPTPKVIHAIDEALSRHDSLYTQFTRSRNYETLMKDFHKGFENN